MRSASNFSRRLAAFATSALTVFGAIHAPAARAQAPYLLPYTIQKLAGGGSAPVGGATCTGANGTTGTAYDTIGDGCPVSSNNIVLAASGTPDIHDVVVDGQGNVYFLDNQSNGLIRRIDGRSGIVTVYAGTPFTQPTVGCTVTRDKYGDGCPANDGKANVVPTAPPGGGTAPPYLYTANIAKARGLAIARNGDVYLADYSGNVIHKIPLSTGIFTFVSGMLTTSGVTTKTTGYIGTRGYSGDGTIADGSLPFSGPAGAAESQARGVSVDAAGNVFIADTGNNVVRKVNASDGKINTIVGSTAGTAGSTGDGGPAASALLAAPEDVEIDPNGNLYIADFANSRVRVVYGGGAQVAKLISVTNNGATAVVGNIYTIMGGGTGVYTAGQVVVATSVPVLSPRKLALDARNNLYLADNGNNVIWFLDVSTGYMRVIAGSYGAAGTGCAQQTDAIGDNCPATSATLVAQSAMGVGVDALGQVYITDNGNKLLRRVESNQTFQQVAVGASASRTLQIHFAASDAPAAGGFSVRGSAEFTAGTPACNTNADATTDCLITLTYTPAQPGPSNANLAVTSTANGVSLIGVSGTGIGAAIALDPGATASYATGFTTPRGIAQDAAGTTYVADTGSNRVLRIASGGGVPTVFAGTGTASFTGDGAAATAATLSAPAAVATGRDGSVYIADTGNNVIRRVDCNGIITTLIGNGTGSCASSIDTFGDGCAASSIKLNAPAGIAADLTGNLYIADTGNNLIRELTVSGVVDLIGGGASTLCASGDAFGNGCPGSQAVFKGPTALQLDAANNLYLADTGNNLVRKIASNGVVTNVAGTGQAGAAGNGGPATGAQLSAPGGLALDAAANVYIADTGNSVVRVVNALGTINSVVGTLGASGAGTLPGAATVVQLNSPGGVASNGVGRLLVLDSGNSRIVVDNRASVTFDFGRVNLGTSSPALQIQETSTGSARTTLGSPSFSSTSTAPGAFTLTPSGSNGCTSGQVLNPGSACFLSAQFTPQTLGTASATFTESTTPALSPTPFIQLTGTGATLSRTSSATVVTSPATGSPQYLVPFTVTTTVTPAACNPAAPSCFPTGTVTFVVDGTQVGLPVTVDATGKASASIPGLSVGVHNVVASYSGDSFYAASSAASLAVTIVQGTTTTTVSASPSTSFQFDDLTLTAKVTTPIAGAFPTGKVNFYAGSVLIATAAVSPTTGIATISDKHIAMSMQQPEVFANSFGLTPGTYSLTAVYAGDANYAPSTSAAAPLIIQADPQTFALSLTPSAIGTAQGSTAGTTITITPKNTLGGTITFACAGLPAHTSCTFGPPTTLVFTPVPGMPATQSIAVTIFTDVPDSALSPSASMQTPMGSSHTAMLAGALGWPLLLLSLGGMLGFRRQLSRSRLFGILVLFGLLAGGSAALSGCSQGGNFGTAVTPIGTYNVQVVATGANGFKATAPITFTVTAGIPGQL